MRQALIVAAVGSGELLLATLLPSPAHLLVGWVGATTCLIALAIGLGRTGLLGKSAAGLLPWWSYLLFSPWHLVVRGSAAQSRRKEPVVQELAPGWFLGGWPAPPGPYHAVLDLTCELPRRLEAESYLCLPTWDGTAPHPDRLDRAARWLVEQRRAGPVLVHCAHGHGRSATVLAAAWVLAGVQPSWQEAIQQMREARPSVRPNPAQVRSLRRWSETRADAASRGPGSPAERQPEGV